MKRKTKQLYAFLQEMEDSREKQILIRRYGLFGCEEKTQRELAGELGISRSYVSRIEKKAVSYLRSRFADDKPEGKS